MKIALGIVSLSEVGGLQRDCLALADALQARGHEVELFAARCVAPWSASRSFHLLASRRTTNHGLDLAFAQALRAAVGSKFDLVVGFNKMPGLDVYYCADPCLAAKPVAAWKRLLPRYRARLALERACFEPASATSMLLLSGEAVTTYRSAWRTPQERLVLLPPRIAPNRARPDLRAPAPRQAARSAQGLGEQDVVWLWVATQPGTKGLDRVIAALAHQDRTRLLVAGLPQDDRKARPCLQLAQRLNVGERIGWLGHRDDIPTLMAVADLLVHPARLDVTGQVILEAIANGLPVVASAVCGFAPHVAAAGAGAVVAEPFEQSAFAGALALAQDPAIRQAWSEGALAYGRRHDFARGLDAAAVAIEQIALAKMPGA